MNNLNIISKINFENVSVGNFPANTKDNNKYSTLTWSGSANTKVEEINQEKFLQIKGLQQRIFSNTAYTPNNAIRDWDFQVEIDIQLLTMNATNGYYGFSNSGSRSISFFIRNTFNKGLLVILQTGMIEVSCNYKFEINKRYNIVITKQNDVYSFMINGEIIGNTISSLFTTNIPIMNVVSQLGSCDSSTITDNMSYGNIYGMNISLGSSLKYDKSFTKYGANLISKLNFGNLSTASTATSFTCDLESVIDSVVSWQYDKSKINVVNEWLITNNTSFKTNIDGDYTITTNIINNKNVNSIDLFNINQKYKVKYTLIKLGEPQPEVIINANTKSALDFENGIIDKIGTTVWNKEGTGNVTSVNKIFGDNSFETKNSNDTLTTTAQLLTGSGSPYTIEYYFLYKGKFTPEPIWDAPIFTRYASGDIGNYLNTSTYNISFHSVEMGLNNSNIIFGKTKLKPNEINKVTMSYDGSAIRMFINDKLDNTLGTNIGFITRGNQPYRFFSRNSDDQGVNQLTTTSGLIDNINIFDGEARVVRDYDEHADKLIVDLAFDGENNSTKIVDNANLTQRSTVKYNDYVMSLLHFDDLFTDEVGNDFVQNNNVTVTQTYKKFGVSSLQLGATDNSYITCTNNNLIFGNNDYTIECFFSVSGGNNNIFTFDGGTVYIDEPAKLVTLYSDTNRISITGVNINTWMHVALVRKSGNVSLYLDGIKSTSWFDNRNHNIGLIKIGGSQVGIGGTYFVDEFRLTNGIARYTENFNAPTEQFNYIKHNKWTVSGGAKISTDQKFDGFSSLYIPSSTNKRNIVSSETIFLPKTEDFTLSFKFKRLPSTDQFAVVLTTGIALYITDTDAAWSINAFTSSYPNQSYPNIRNKFSLLNEKNFTGYDSAIISNTTILDNVEYDVSFVKKDTFIYLYINGVLDVFSDVYKNNDIDFKNLCIGSELWTGAHNGFTGYIKNLKIYKDVAIIPESPVGKIQLDFDNNLTDKYNNSTWTNNGVTFDQVNSVKGSAAKFNGSNSILSISNNQNLNFENKNFVLSYDFKNAIFDSVNNRYLLGNGMALAHGAFWRLFGTSSSKYGSVNLNYNSTNYGLTNTVEVENNYYNEKILRNSDTLVGFKNDVAISALNVINAFNVDFKNMSIGTASSLTGGVSYFNGYIDNFKSYKEDLLSKIDIYSTVSSSYTVINGDKLSLTVSQNQENIIKFKDCPNVKNFKAKFKIKNISGLDQILFRTTNWSTVNASFGYCVNISDTTTGLGKGSNSQSGSWDWIITNSIPKPAYATNVDRTYEVTIICNELNTKVYINDILYIDIDDSTHLVSGQLGIRKYGEFSGNHTTEFISMDIFDLNDNLLYHNDFKSKIDNVIDKPAVHLPLETNAINTGFTYLTVNSVGSPTYTTIDGKKCIKFESGKYLTINSNNIFNLGTSSDFYVEFDINIISFLTYNMILTNNNSWIAGSQSIWITNTGKVVIQSYNGLYKETLNVVNLNTWTTIKLYRKGNIVSISIDDVTENFIINDSINLSVNNLYIGCSGWAINNDRLNGHISNFKMFVGTSEIPETYNDKKVLDLDFKPTRKSYLFKDNNNKCVIHPVNITQRDYQDSQYCCTFNGTNQYLQLGKNDLLNFGLDDFIIKIVFKTTSNNNLYSGLITNAQTSATNMDFIMVHSGTNMSCRMSNIIIFENLSIVPNVINEFIMVRKDNMISVYLNNELRLSNINLVYEFNLNRNNNTYIGANRWDSGTTGYFQGQIYSIQVLRNTTDLSLLTPTEIITESKETFELTNGTEIETIEFNEIEERNIKVVNDTTKISLSVNDQVVEVLKDTTPTNEIELFNGYIGNIKDIKLYNTVLPENDYFEGSVWLDTEFGEVEIYEDQEDDYEIFFSDYVLEGFIEGYTDHKYNIVYEDVIVLSGIEDYEYNNVNLAYINEYFIHDLDIGNKYPVNKNEMIKGYISGSVNLVKCGVTAPNMKVYCYRSDTYRLIGIYDVNSDGKYNIPNLDVNSRYDIIFRDTSRTIKDQISNYRKPVKY